MNNEKDKAESTIADIIQQAGEINSSQLYYALKGAIGTSRYIGIITSLKSKGMIDFSGPMIVWRGGIK